jgi:hypothetical protein
MLKQNSNLICWLCGKSVDVTACKTDEHGKAVHEACYVVRIALEASSRKAPASLTSAGGPLAAKRNLP